MTGTETGDLTAGTPIDERARSVELLFDEAADARVRAEWDALAAAGLSSLAPYTAPSNAPHLTLLERRFPLPEGLELNAVALPLPLVLGPPVLLGTGDRRVLARSVLPTPGLLDVRAAVHAAVGAPPRPDRTVSAIEDPRWLPHVTLARRLRLADVATALGLLGEDIQADGSAVRAWDPVTSRITVLAKAQTSAEPVRT